MVASKKPGTKSTKPAAKVAVPGPGKALKDYTPAELKAAAAQAKTNGNSKRGDAVAAEQKTRGGTTGDGTSGSGDGSNSEIIDKNNDKLLDNVGRSGTLTEGTNIGNVRQIVGPNLGNAAQIDPSQLKIAPTDQYNSSQIGPTSQYGGATIDQGAQNEVRAQQMGFANQLQQQALGQGPSVAGLQLNAALDKNVAQQNALAASSNGVGRLLAQRRAAITTAGLGQDAARQSALTRMAEQLNAQQLLGTQQNNIRTNDIGVATNQAGLVNQAGINSMEEANKAAAAQATLNQSAAAGNAGAVNTQNAQQALIDQQTAAANANSINQMTQNQGQLDANADRYNQTEFDQRNSTQGQINAGIANTGTSAAAQVAGANINAGAQNSVAQIQANTAAAELAAQQKAQEETDANNKTIIADNEKNAAAANNTANNSAIGNDVGAVGTIVNGIIQTSDRRAKKDIKPADDKMKGFLDNLNAYDWKYKGGDGKTNNGVMAQDLEKSDVGREMVMDTPKGKMVDYGKGLASILAAQSMLNKRLDALEKKKKAA